MTKFILTATLLIPTFCHGVAICVNNRNAKLTYRDECHKNERRLTEHELSCAIAPLGSTGCEQYLRGGDGANSGGGDGAGAPTCDSCVGEEGEEGPQGPVGPQGEIGPRGISGPAGQNGAVGAVGPKGDRGESGAAGPIGATGSAGPIGPKGSTGSSGPQGPQGAVGPIGPQGVHGEAGAAGVCEATLDCILVIVPTGAPRDYCESIERFCIDADTGGFSFDCSLAFWNNTKARCCKFVP